MLSWPQRREKVPPSPTPGVTEGLGACWGLRMPALSQVVGHNMQGLQA